MNLYEILAFTAIGVPCGWLVHLLARFTKREFIIGLIVFHAYAVLLIITIETHPVPLPGAYACGIIGMVVGGVTYPWGGTDGPKRTDIRQGQLP